MVLMKWLISEIKLAVGGTGGAVRWRSEAPQGVSLQDKELVIKEVKKSICVSTFVSAEVYKNMF